MIDKREERAADRQLAIRLAAMLGGTLPTSAVIIDVSPQQRLLGDGDEGDPEFDPGDLDGV
jgi:hypothetical protein